MVFQFRHSGLLFISLSLLLTLQCTAPKPGAEFEDLDSDDALQSEAQRFDSYLNGSLSQDDLDGYILSCNTESSTNPFCFSVRERERMEKLVRNSPPKKTTRPSGGTTKIRFNKKKIANWPDLRFASVSSIIKGLGLLSLNNIEAVRTYVLNEKRCPNNAALAIASQFEEYLRDKLRYQELARLYEKAAECPMDGPETQEMLWTRTGLFYLAGNEKKLALKAFKKATQTNAIFKARSLYWLYKTELDTSDFKSASDTFITLRENYPFSFHTLIALTSRNEDPGKILEQATLTEKKRSSSNTEINQLLEQVEILHNYKFHVAGARLLEWVITLAQVESDPELKVYISDLREVQGDYRSQISLLSEVLYENPRLISRVTMEKYFPKPYFPIFQGNSEGIDPFLLMAIARRESAFNPRALSSANARGLLQVTPQTLRTFDMNHDLFEPSSNVKAGARIFGDLLRRLNGQIHLALAAYNAGPKRVTTWTARYPLEDPILFIDLIPYRETREYVAAVLRNYYWYQKLNRTDQVVSPRTLLEHQSADSLPMPNTQQISPNRNVPE